MVNYDKLSVPKMSTDKKISYYFYFDYFYYFDVTFSFIYFDDIQLFLFWLIIDLTFHLFLYTLMIYDYFYIDVFNNTFYRHNIVTNRHSCRLSIIVY